MMRQPLISSYFSRVSVLSLLLLCCVSVSAQRQRKIIAHQPDTIPLFRGIAVSADLVGVAQLTFGDYGQYEAALRVNLKDKYFPVFELGYGKADANDVATRLAYKAHAPYARAGLDFNVMKNKHDIYRFYTGFRYAFTSFKYDVDSPGITDPVWREHVEFEAHGVSCSYHWLEAVAGIDAKLWGPVRLGWRVRYKRRLFHREGQFGNAWYVPGFGKGSNSRLGGTFNIIVEL